MADELRMVRNFVGGRIAELLNSGSESATRAALANLRRGIGREPGSIPELWGLTLEGMPAELYSQNGVPTRGEWAVYIALTMFALHQQGKDLKRSPMNCKDISLGRAVRKLVEGDDEKRVKRRFDKVVTADSPQELSHHLRGLVQLFKSKDIPLDYAQLSADLFLFQFESPRDTVRLRWAQDFYRYVGDEQKEGQND
ncbi:MAG: type I-E CRISPR-associated protein Cse2/CasB [Clostridia bacterium]|nr:type I-E CRISPR-associated protein Cse2/CasB [Clostridia bacterium]